MSEILNIGNLFPYLCDKRKLKNLKIDDDSIHYISIRKYSEKITNIILFHLKDLNLNANDIIITDATAGVGGNVLSFSKIFKWVYAVEIDKLRYSYLENNLKVYETNNVKIYNDDCLHIVNEIEDHNVIFIDPPWGGKSYKNHKLLELKISDIYLEYYCNKLLDPEFMKKIPNMIVLKLPTNYNIKLLYESIDKKHSIYLHDLKKMLIIIIYNKNNIEIKENN